MKARATVSVARCDALASRLELDVMSTGICFACPSFVCIPLSDGYDAEARREARRMTPHRWDEGLEGPVLAALGRARDAGLEDAEEAVLDVESRGFRSGVVRAIVLRLARDLEAPMRADDEVTDAARRRLPLASPELN